MAIYYVYSGAGGSNNGSSWANAFTTLTTAFVTEAAGDTLYMAHDHAESSASALTLTSSGTVANPTKVICVNRSGTVPPVPADRRATATVTTTGNTNITINGYTHYDGIIFSAGNSTGAANISFPGAVALRFDNCSLRLAGTSAASRIIIGQSASGTLVILNNTTASFAQISQGFTTSGTLKWNNTPSALLGTISQALFQFGSGWGGNLECIGVDFSAAGSGKTIMNAQTVTGVSQTHRFIDCKLNASVTKSTAPNAPGSGDIDFVRSGSSGVNYTVHSQRMSGLLVEETTIVRAAGASDGTTPLAWKIVTTTDCTYSIPFECPPIAVWNDTTGASVTATVEGIAATLPTDQEVWLEVEYLGDASSPQGSFINDGKPDLITAAANQTTSSETWGGSTTAFKLAVAFTPQQKGWIYARVKVGKASSTFYIDPLVTLT